MRPGKYAQRLMRTLEEGSFSGKRVLLRVDINSPLDPATGKIANENRILKSVETIQALAEQGAKLVIIAHQGDTTDYKSLVGLQEHASRLAAALGMPVQFIEDLAGPAAVAKILALASGEVLLLDNLRYLTEEASTFEDAVSLRPQDMTGCYLVRRLAPLFDCYVNDAFAAAHRNSPSMVAFQQLMPSYMGKLLKAELDALRAITGNPPRPCTWLLGGARAGDAFGMIEQVLRTEAADCLLLSGLVGQIFMLADGVSIGKASTRFIEQKGFAPYIAEASEALEKYRSKIHYPSDVAVVREGQRTCIPPGETGDEEEICDIGDETIAAYIAIINASRTLFVNGPAGVYEAAPSERGTRLLWNAVAAAEAYSVIGGGDTVTSFERFADASKIDYISTAGGALIRYLSGARLPLLEAIGADAV